MQRNDPIQGEIENFFGFSKEETEVKEFLCKAPEVKNIYRIYKQEPDHIYHDGGAPETNDRKNQFRTFLNELQRAKTFLDLDKATDLADFEKLRKERPDDPTAKLLGVFGMKTVLYVGSFFSTDASFFAQIRNLRERLVKHMEATNYFLRDTTITNAHG